MYTTTITVKITIATQGGPADAIKTLKCALDYRAVERAEILNLETDWRRITAYGDTENFEAVSNTPNLIVDHSDV